MCFYLRIHPSLTGNGSVASDSLLGEEFYCDKQWLGRVTAKTESSNTSCASLK